MLTGETACRTILIKHFFLIFVFQQSGIIALTIEVIDTLLKSTSNLQLYICIYTHIHNFLTCLFMYLKNLTYFVQLSTSKDDFCLVKSNLR